MDGAVVQGGSIGVRYRGAVQGGSGEAFVPCVA